MIWKDVVGFEGLYEVSDEGVVRNAKTKKIRRTHCPRGYEQIVLCKGGLTFNVYVHKLVLEAFVGLCPSGQETRHGDNVRNNNRLDNLSWGTRVENAEDKVAHGSAPILEQNGRALLTSEQAIEIHHRANAGEPLAGLSGEFGVDEVTISHIKRGYTWGRATGAAHTPARIFVTTPLKEQMQALRDAGVSLSQIAKRCGVSRPTAFRNTVNKRNAK